MSGYINRKEEYMSVFKLFTGNSPLKRHLGGPRPRRKDNISKYHKDI